MSARSVRSPKKPRSWKIYENVRCRKQRDRLVRFTVEARPDSTIKRADATELLTRGISTRSVSIRNYRAFLRSQQRLARLERDDRHGAKFNESRLTGVPVTPRNRIR